MRLRYRSSLARDRPEGAVVGHGATNRQEHDVGMRIVGRYADHTIGKGDRGDFAGTRGARRMVRHRRQDEFRETGPALAAAQ